MVEYETLGKYGAINHIHIAPDYDAWKDKLTRLSKGRIKYKAYIDGKLQDDDFSPEALQAIRNKRNWIMKNG